METTKFLVRTGTDMRQTLGCLGPEKKSILLYTPFGAIAYTGPGYFLTSFLQSLSDLSKLSTSLARITLALDCGENPSIALGALRACLDMQRHLRSNPLNQQKKALLEKFSVVLWITCPREILKKLSSMGASRDIHITERPLCLQ